MKTFTTVLVAVLVSLTMSVPASAQFTTDDFAYFFGPDSGTAYGLGVDAMDNLYVVDGNKVFVVQPDGTLLATLTSGLFDQPRGIAVDPATGDLYVANQGNGTIVKVENATTTPSYSTWQTGLAGPFDVAINGGVLYVSETDFICGPDDDEVKLFTLATGASAGAITGVFCPTGLAFDADGNLYIANNTSSASGAVISKVAAGGTVVTDANFAMLDDFRSGYEPWFLAFGPVRLGDSEADQLFPAPAGSLGLPQVLYLTDHSNRNIDYVESDGTVNQAYQTVGQPRPTGLNFDSVGNMYFGVTSAVNTFAVLRSVKAFPVLPVELVSFEAVADGDRVVLSWKTASETNNAGFELQRRAGSAYETLGFVEGHGTIAREQRYEYTLRNLPAGKHVFRLKQVDYDGAFEYSPEVEVTIEIAGTYELTAAYPNPFNPQTQFALSLAQNEQVRVAVYDVLGRAVVSLHDGWLEAGTAHQFTFDGAGLPSGTYLIQAQGETFRASRTVTLLK